MKQEGAGFGKTVLESGERERGKIVLQNCEISHVPCHIFLLLVSGVLKIKNLFFSIDYTN